MTAGRMAHSDESGGGSPVAPRAGADMSALGPYLFVPFAVRRLARASVLWLNRRWFLEQGLDLADAEIEVEVTRWLLRDFGVAAPIAADPSDGYGSEEDVRWADRYGLSEGGWHGGSGRCGAKGQFHAKGLGRTPLVSENADAMHSSGLMHISEALLETVTSEVAHAELPYGCVPVVAIIDMGFAAPVDEGMPSRRRAIVVRPNFIRPSHFERSIFFGDAGTRESAQYLDAQRVRDAVSAALTVCPSGSVDAESFLSAMFLRDARQLATARAHRFWLGIFASSNRAITGELADFGAFRALPSWRAATTPSPEQFGAEYPILKRTVAALCHYFGKYRPASEALPDPPRLEVLVTAELELAFRSACASAMGAGVDDKWASPAVQAVCEYYAAQQLEKVRSIDRPAWRRPWLLDALAPGWRRSCEPGPLEHVTAGAILGSIGSTGDGAALSAGRLNATRRWLTPRPLLFQEVMFSRIASLAGSLTGNASEDSRRVGRFVERSIAGSRRVWADIPPHIEVVGQATASGSAALYCRDLKSGAQGSLVFGRILKGHFHALGARVEIDPEQGLQVLTGARGSLWLDKSDPLGSRTPSAELHRRAAHMEHDAYFYPFHSSR